MKSSTPSIPKHILLAEDDEGIREAMREILEDEGYALTVAEDGAVLLDRLITQPPPDLLILDLVMPTMDGWAFLAARKANAELMKIPVIVVTADCKADVSTAGAEGLLFKPFDVVALLKVVDKVLRASSASDV